MAHIFVTGSADGLGREAAQTLLRDGHRVIVHARSAERLAAVKDLIGRGASSAVGDLADLNQTREVADQVNGLGHIDAVIHNAGIYTGAQIMPVNIVAPYLLTALINRAGEKTPLDPHSALTRQGSAPIDRPQRLVYLSSGSHYGGRADLAGVDWSGRRRTGSYADSKLFVTTLAVAVARLWPDVYSNAVDPGWVPTKMGGPGAPDDLRLGHLTQEWLAISNEPNARSSGGYWFHQRLRTPHPAVHDTQFQDSLLAELARFTGVPLT